jgi:hypothetical protein
MRRSLAIDHMQHIGLAVVVAFALLAFVSTGRVAAASDSHCRFNPYLPSASVCSPTSSKTHQAKTGKVNTPSRARITAARCFNPYTRAPIPCH